MNRIVLTALPDVPIARPGNELDRIVLDGLRKARLRLRTGHILVVCSKLVARAEGRFVALATVEPSAAARELAQVVEDDPRMVELVLRESVQVSRASADVLVVRHRSGMVLANAGIDRSNVGPPTEAGDGGAGDWVLLLPEAPDSTASRLHRDLFRHTGARVGVVISDSHGRPFRLGSTGVAIGVAGMPALLDHRGRSDLFGRPLRSTQTALADQIAGAADLLAGPADEGHPIIHVTGVETPAAEGSAADLVRPLHQDLYC